MCNGDSTILFKWLLSWEYREWQRAKAYKIVLVDLSIALVAKTSISKAGLFSFHLDCFSFIIQSDKPFRVFYTYFSS